MRKKHEFPGGFDAKKMENFRSLGKFDWKSRGVNFKKIDILNSGFFFLENPMYYRYGFRPCDLVQIVAN